jgi:NAD dependent epimerase/dehydratase family enzyme
MLDGADAVIHLAGEPVAQRWTTSVKQRIRDSRVEGTRKLVRAIAAARPKPAVLVSGSAIGIYGSRGDEILTEASEPGEGFLADVVREWESAADEASPRWAFAWSRFGRESRLALRAAP